MKLNKPSVILLIVSMLLINIRSMFVMDFEVHETSMTPTLLDSQTGSADKLLYKVFGVDRFDIVIFNNSDKLLIKRVIGLPGESIQYKNNHLVINNEVVEEYFIDDLAKSSTLSSISQYSKALNDGFKLGEDEYFVMGDNRISSKDSRTFGPIKHSQIEAKVYYVKK